ncbi:MAG: FAD-dependent oxidoreductase [Anaerolineae bacterium]|jgi:glycerol-3-phosphate dehydrogenase|nr:MAG: FAD-dependent oxidoreductase [Anaerolineae bacterium]
MIWETSREQIWQALETPWDVIIIGGGILGAGIFFEASAAGLKTLLLEARDFSFGTSSRSGKFIHGGLRYLRNGQVEVTYPSVREREHLIAELPGGIQKVSMHCLRLYTDRFSPARMQIELAIYELMAGRLGFEKYTFPDIAKICPGLSRTHVLAMYKYYEGLMDDARLVLRIIREGVRRGGVALNYAQVLSLRRLESGKVVGVIVQDQTSSAVNRVLELDASLVIQATGYWDIELDKKKNTQTKVRKSRGSHLLIDSKALPIAVGLTYFHPHDQRIQFLVPWQGAILAGTTDIDEVERGEDEFYEPAITQSEVDYLLSGINYLFPDIKVDQHSLLSTFCGLRPLVDDGVSQNVSKVSRRHHIIEQDGLLSVIGGKLTTYRIIAHEVLKVAQKYLRLNKKGLKLKIPEFTPFRADPTIGNNMLSYEQIQRLLGSYGSDFGEFIRFCKPDDFTEIENTSTLLGEIRWAAHNEAVVHLDDLLIRRVRLGLILPDGGKQVLSFIKPIVHSELQWDENRWNFEVKNYLKRWQKSYSPSPWLS